MELLPSSFSELARAGCVPASIEALVFTGAYPRIYDKQLDPQRGYADYVMTYLERDVRQVKNVTDLNLFQRFLKMCAARGPSRSDPESVILGG